MMLSRSYSALTRVDRFKAELPPRAYPHSWPSFCFPSSCHPAEAGAHALEAEWMASPNLGHSDSQTQLDKLLFFINYPDLGILL